MTEINKVAFTFCLASSKKIKYTFMKNTLLLIVSTLLIITACKNNEQASPSPDVSAIMKQDSLNKRNKQIALGCIHAAERGDVEYIISHNAKETVDYYEDRPPMRGTDSLRIALRQMLSMLKEFKSSNELAIADSNYVFVYYNGDETLKTDSFGKTHHSAGVHIFKFNEEGKIIEHAHVGEELISKDFFNKQ